MTSQPPDQEPIPDPPAVDPPAGSAARSRQLPPVSARHAVLAAVLDRPAANTVELHTLTGFSRPAVHRALLELEAAGLLRRQLGDARGPGSPGRGPDRWYPTDSTAEHADPTEIAAAGLTRRPGITDRRAVGGPARHRLLAGLLDVLPAPGTPLPADLRDRWMAAADLALTLLYPDPTQPDRPPGELHQPTPDPATPAG